MLPIVGPPVLRATFGQLLARKAKSKLMSAALDALLTLLPNSGDGE